MQVVSSYPNNMFFWVDLATTDPAAAKEFYGGLFGWEYEDRPTLMGFPYTIFQIEGYSVAGLCAMPQGMQEQNVPPTWTSYIKNDDVDAVAAKVAAAGGTIMMPPMDMMEAGRLTMIQDPAGAVFGVWQLKELTGAQLVNIPNALVWNELQTRDADGARKFYQSVFDWGHDADPTGYHLFKLGDRFQAGMLQIEESWGDMPPNWATYFMAENIEATAAKAQELGGTILVPATAAGAMGRFSVIQDPQGGVFTAMQFDGPVDPPPGY